VTNSTPGTVSVIDTATNTVIGPAVAVGSSPMGIATSADNKRVYVGVSGGVAVLDTSGANPVLLTTIALVTGGRDVAFKP